MLFAEVQLFDKSSFKVVSSFSHITEDEAYVVRLQKLCMENKVLPLSPW